MSNLKEIGEHHEGDERKERKINDAELRNLMDKHLERQKESIKEKQPTQETKEVNGVEYVDVFLKASKEYKGDYDSKTLIEEIGRPLQQALEGGARSLSEGMDNVGQAVEGKMEKVGDAFSKLEQPKEKSSEPTAQELGEMARSLQDDSHEGKISESSDRSKEGIEPDEIADSQDLEPTGVEEVEEHSMEHKDDAQVPLLDSHTLKLEQGEITCSNEPKPKNLKLQGLMERYHVETNKNAIKGFRFTKRFQNWLKGDLPAKEKRETMMLLNACKAFEKVLHNFKLDELREIAQAHGGECLATEFVNYKTEYPFRCENGHEWAASGFTIKKGHWCRDCYDNSRTKYDWTKPETKILAIKYVHDYAKTHDGKPPPHDLFIKHFGGVGFRKGFNKTYNKFLVEDCDIQPNKRRDLDWTKPKTMELVRDYIREYAKGHEGKAPPLTVVRNLFGGFQSGLAFINKKYNQFIKEDCGVEPNLEFNFDWTAPGTVELVKDYIFEYASENDGKAPGLQLTINEFSSGFDKYLQDNNTTYNQFLEQECNLTPNIIFEHNWASDSPEWKVAQKKIVEFYKEHKRPPSQRESRKFVGGGFEAGLKRQGKTYNLFLVENCKIPITDLDQAQIEGDQFDRAAKKAVKVLHGASWGRVYHPDFAQYGREYLEPDGIIHDFAKRPIKRVGKSFFLEKGQKFDLIFEFKRTFGGIGAKDSKLTPLIAENLKYYFYIKPGKVKDREIEGCHVTHHTKKELLDELQSHIRPSNKAKILKIIEEIKMIGKDPNSKAQKSLSDF